MSENTNILTETLNKHYEKVVQAVLDSNETLVKNQTIYQKNLKAINHSLNDKIAQFDKRVDELDAAFKQALNALERKHKKANDTLDNQRATAISKHKKALATIDEDLESKRTLNTLQEQKIETTLKTHLEQIQKKYADRLKQLKKQFDQTNEKFYDQSLQLEKETDIMFQTEDNHNRQVNIDISQTMDDRQDQSVTLIAELEKERLEREKQLTTKIKQCKTAYKKALEPIDKELAQLETTYKEDVEAIEASFEGEISKKIKYQTEKEKLGDNAAANEYAKAIKKLKKELNQTLNDKKNTHKSVKDPILKNKQDTINQHAEHFLRAKQDGIEAIKETLIKIQHEKTKNMVDTNYLNIDLLKQQATHTHKTAEIQIDYDIQLINFNQTLEEAKLYYDYHADRLKPEEALETSEKKRDYNQDKNDLTKSRSFAKSFHKKDSLVQKLNHAAEIDHFNHEFKRTEALQTFESRAHHIDYAIDLIKKDFEKEQILIRHYYTHAKNYTALKNESILAHQDKITLEIENRKALKIKDFKAMIKQAEKDHKIITEQIDDTYNKEIIIYESAYNTVQKNQQETIQALVNAQADERNKDLEKINTLDPKENKSEIKRLKRNLAVKQDNHDEALALKKRELEQKLTVYKKMIESIKSFRLHSLEEADTLLIHIKDQTALAIQNVESAAQNDLEAFNRLYYEIKHSAELFETFQLQREEDTVSETSRYQNTRIQKEETTKAAYKKALDETLDKAKTALEAFLKNNREDIVSAEEAHQKALNQIEATKDENHHTIEEQYHDEKRRLESAISKLNKQYDDDLKTLSQEKETEKQACFHKKDQAEKALKDALSTREKEAEAYEEERLNLQNKTIERFDEHSHKLIKHIREDAFTHIDEDKVKEIHKLITGDLTL